MRSEEILGRLENVDRLRVLIMGQGRTRREPRQNEWIIEACKEYGFGYTPRLHIELFGNRRHLTGAKQLICAVALDLPRVNVLPMYCLSLVDFSRASLSLSAVQTGLLPQRRLADPGSPRSESQITDYYRFQIVRLRSRRASVKYGTFEG